MSNSRFFFRPQVTTFVLFLVGRVGSTYLTTLLQTHPNILARSEELRDLEAHGAQAQLTWAEKFLSPPLVGRYGAYGFNVKPVHIKDLNGFAQILRNKNCKIIQMQRRNRIKAVVSLINGRRLHRKTGMWGMFDESERLPPLKISLTEFDDLLRQRETRDQELEDYVRSLDLPTLRLYYEEMLADQPLFLEELFDFLGVHNKPVTGRTLKITNDDLSQVILNFSELRSSYAKTDYAAMFDEGMESVVFTNPELS